MSREPTDDGWTDPQATKVAPAPRLTAELPKEQLDALVKACRLPHPRAVRR